VSPDTAPVSAPLTSRELDVLAQVALGRTNGEAAKRPSLRPENEATQEKWRP
jgi:LuxR family transcriptional regulator, regulator of acetate metabolism